MCSSNFPSDSLPRSCCCRITILFTHFWNIAHVWSDSLSTALLDRVKTKVFSFHQWSSSFRFNYSLFASKLPHFLCFISIILNALQNSQCMFSSLKRAHTTLVKVIFLVVAVTPCCKVVYSWYSQKSYMYTTDHLRNTSLLHFTPLLWPIYLQN